MGYAVSSLLPGHHLGQVPASAEQLLMTCWAAALAVGTYLLVRSWVTSSTQDRQPAIPWRQAAGIGATVALAYVAAMLLSQKAWQLGQTVLGVEDTSYPQAPGQLGALVLAMATSALAGLVEEPVYVGLVVLFWPRLSRRTFIPLALLSGTARSVIHLYYAAGTDRMVLAIAMVMLWCLAWSSVALYLVYRTRTVWPVALGHGLSNLFACLHGPFQVEETPLTYAVMIIPFLAVFVVVLFALKDLAARISRVVDPIVARRWPHLVQNDDLEATAERHVSVKAWKHLDT